MSTSSLTLKWKTRKPSAAMSCCCSRSIASLHLRDPTLEIRGFSQRLSGSVCSFGDRCAVQSGPQSCQAPTAPAARPLAPAAPPPAAICRKTTEPETQSVVKWPKIRVVAASGWRRAAKRAGAGRLRDQHDLERCARAVRRPGPPPRAGRGAERAPSPPSRLAFSSSSSGGERRFWNDCP